MLALIAILLIGQEPVPADVKQAISTLAATPDDQKAATVAGRWYAQAGDWEKAVPLLAKSSDEELRKLVEREAAAKENGFDAVEIGDSWLKQAARNPKAKVSYRARAMTWYARGWSSVADQFWKMKLREKLLSISGVTDAPIRPGPAPKWWDLYEVGKTCAVDSVVAHSGTHSIRIWNAPEDMTKKPGAVGPPMAPKAGATYKISAWVLTDGTDAPGEVRIRFWDSSTKFIGQFGAIVPVDAPYWQEIKAEVKVPDGAAKMDIQVIVLSKSGRTWVDDVSVKLDDKELVQNTGFER